MYGKMLNPDAPVREVAVTQAVTQHLLAHAAHIGDCQGQVLPADQVSDVEAVVKGPLAQEARLQHKVGKFSSVSYISQDFDLADALACVGDSTAGAWLCTKVLPRLCKLVLPRSAVVLSLWELGLLPASCLQEGGHLLSSMRASISQVVPGCDLLVAIAALRDFYMNSHSCPRLLFDQEVVAVAIALTSHCGCNCRLIAAG
mmetsp:Transcript_47664/g.132647  ORF Transcript_47664/g.132647 Transcript_47664/m.132647 type:complete len:201 (-) Transcript_47664:283-885(-)